MSPRAHHARALPDLTTAGHPSSCSQSACSRACDHCCWVNQITWKVCSTAAWSATRNSAGLHSGENQADDQRGGSVGWGNPRFGAERTFQTIDLSTLSPTHSSARPSPGKQCTHPHTHRSVARALGRTGGRAASPRTLGGTGRRCVARWRSFFLPHAGDDNVPVGGAAGWRRALGRFAWHRT